ncbi:GNAT family N-acetyltransferase [Micromonospora sp. NPDC050417]|uniref:GNAT family N-acetyltransferase n=1 Tax=Micromonospora sp. NPDC050417 TaxID=3364280 RepID=UPI0037A9B0BE
MNVVLWAEAAPGTVALWLRPWSDDDLETLVETYRDPALRRWTRSPVTNEQDAARWLEIRHEGWRNGDYLSFAVLTEGQDGRLVANVVLKLRDASRRIGEVGYWTAAYARGQGVAPRALEVLTSWAFDTFGADGLERLELLHQIDNPASCRVAEKSRYAYERTLPARPPFPNDGHLHVRRPG